MRRTLAALAIAGAALAAGAAASAATAGAPKIAFKPDGAGWYVVTATPPAPVLATLSHGSDCNFVFQVCHKWTVIGTKLLPKSEAGRVSWLKASFWGLQHKGDVLPSGFYHLDLKVPGKPASVVSTSWQLSFGH